MGGKDLNSLITNFVIGDDFDERERAIGKGTQFAAFAAHMTTHLTMKLPGLCFRTGLGTCIPGDDSSIQTCLEVAEGGVPLVLLDLRDRPRLAASSRTELIESAWEHYEESCNALMASGTR